MEKFGGFITDTMFKAEGSSEAKRSLSQCLEEASPILRGVASLMVEQLLIKAMSVPAGDRSALCEKIQSSIAGSRYGLQESDVHPSLLALMRANVA